MRTLLAAIVLAALIVGGVAVAVPLIARPMIVAAVQGASPFEGDPLHIEVDCNVFGLLTGTVDRIHVRGANLRRTDATIEAIDVTLTDVGTDGRTFASVDGTLASIQVPLEGGSALAIDEVRLARSSSNMTAVARLDGAAAAQLIEAAFADGGVDISGVELGAGTVAFEIFGTRAEVPIGVEDGAIVLIDPFGTGPFELVKPGENDGWRFTGVVVSVAGMTIDAGLDLERLLNPA